MLSACNKTLRATLNRLVSLGAHIFNGAEMNRSARKLIAFGVLTLFFRQVPTAAQSFFNANPDAHEVLGEFSSPAPLDDGTRSISNPAGMEIGVRNSLPAQMVDATLACSLLAGVLKPKVFLGR